MEPVTTQPIPMGAPVSSITTIVSTGGNWSTGLFDVCSDKRICKSCCSAFKNLISGPCSEVRMGETRGALKQTLTVIEKRHCLKTAINELEC